MLNCKSILLFNDLFLYFVLETLRLAAGLLEILTNIEMNNLQLAKDLIKKLVENQCFKSSTEKQKECLDVLIARTNLSKFIFPSNRDMQVYRDFKLLILKFTYLGILLVFIEC